MCNFVNVNNRAGIWPDSKFPLSTRFVRAANAPRVDGIKPVRALSPKFASTKLLKKPNVEGMEPKNESDPKLREVSADN